ncbi:unnamed protein product [Phytophthora lilii]|uniref:Unnamed protein product n=1 Tax=Phytophthora lilii TaxID=2077276 RepID=A0A9W6YJF6_9STRA|nr:unnamed protein product [Phytophthora lilii]
MQLQYEDTSQLDLQGLAVLAINTCICIKMQITCFMLKRKVATVALNFATAGVFGEFIKASEALQLGVKCGQKLFAATSSLVSYVDELQVNATQEQQLLSLVNQSDLVTNELPGAVCT